MGEGNTSADSFSFVHDPHAAQTTATAPHVDRDIPVKLLYSKSKVYVHPSSNVQDFIPGYLSIVGKASHEYLVAWTPEALIPTKDLEAFVQVNQAAKIQPFDLVSTVMIPSDSDIPEVCNLYALSISVHDISSFLITAPSIKQWYGNIVINFKDGHSSAPLWFHDDESRSTVLQKKTQGGKFSADPQDKQQLRWGGDEFMERLSKILPIARSSESSNLYIVSKEKVEESFDEKKPLAPQSADKPTARATASSAGPHRSPSVFESTQMDPFVATLKEAKWNLLEKFSRVTKFSRETAANILGHPASKSFMPLLPPGMQSMAHNETVQKTMEDYDSARIFLAKWAAGLAAQSEQATPVERRYRNVGVWGHDGWEENTALGVFEILNSENDLSIPTHTRTPPVTAQQWRSFFDDDGKLTVGLPYVRKAIFCGGMVPEIRKDAWLFLNHVFPWDSTSTERLQMRKDKIATYESLKAKWKNNDSVLSSAKFQDQKHRIDKDVHRTDRTVPFYEKDDIATPDHAVYATTNENLETLKNILCTYNIYETELGYVQGMSDLLSPLYAVIQDEPMSFWAFAGFMERTKSNFYLDQSGMHSQLLTMDLLLQFMDPILYKHFQRTDSQNLFFCFRWLLVWFKREFEWDDVLTLWEVLWTDHLSSQFHLFVALAILDQHRDVIIDYLQTFDEILKYINDLSMTMNVQEILQRAEILFYQFRQRVEAVDNKRGQLRSIMSKEAVGDEQQRKDAQADLERLPIINDLLRELLVKS
ncbi:rab-GTPase-TBC domain-containing protein [Radiomyces spectabilis]|uniref:rab-GTPase-TBC domain-containing protein n=1 Tax=Radiomyces spectabilis TaxID=64574 RepID=UPI0022211862|nr:rab-GTPase-TBC domain-containing protein [Radiomyces spectabilis]KAI8381458.1 rab-GTPase-TBC domain-containing protein [Radiomyces spectabilis]